MAASYLLLFLLVVKMTSCSASWLDDSDYEDAPSAGDDVTSAEGRKLLLSLLMRASRLNAEEPGPRPYSPEQPASRLEDAYDASLLKDALEQVQRVETKRPSKRARSHISSVLPPFGEMCRAMHIGGCSHSRHR